MIAIAMNVPTPLHIPPQILHDPNPLSHTTLCTSDSEQMLLASSSPLSSNKRPKLSLQTASVPVAVGRSSTALSASVLQTSSPTCLNTFNNAYELPHRSSPTVPTVPSPNTNWPKSIMSNITKRVDHPYEMTMNIRGILKNSPYFSSIRRSITSNTSPRNRRALFPAIKKVTWRNKLEEEIKTVMFTARHSDLASDEDSNDRDTPTLLSRVPVDELQEDDSCMIKADTPNARRYTEMGREEDDDEQLSEPISHVKRKRRPPEWRWTLGPLGEQKQNESDDIPTPVTPSSSSSLRPILSINTAMIRSSCKDNDVNPRKALFPVAAMDDHIEESAIS